MPTASSEHAHPPLKPSSRPRRLDFLVNFLFLLGKFSRQHPENRAAPRSVYVLYEIQPLHDSESKERSAHRGGHRFEPAREPLQLRLEFRGELLAKAREMALHLG